MRSSFELDLEGQRDARRDADARVERRREAVRDLEPDAERVRRGEGEAAAVGDRVAQRFGLIELGGPPKRERALGERRRDQRLRGDLVGLGDPAVLDLLDGGVVDVVRLAVGRAEHAPRVGADGHLHRVRRGDRDRLIREQRHAAAEAPARGELVAGRELGEDGGRPRPSGGLAVEALGRGRVLALGELDELAADDRDRPRPPGSSGCRATSCRR